MQTAVMYQTINNNLGYTWREYVTPNTPVDPKRQIMERINMDYKNKPKQGKFKVTTKPRVSYFDQLAKPYKGNPDPSRYQNSTKAKSFKEAKITKTNSMNLKKNTYIENIEDEQKKRKVPGVAKYDLTKYSFSSERPKTYKVRRDIIKFNNFDDGIKLAAQLPGPGQFNPHKSVPKLKMNKTDYKFFKEKHAKQEKTLKKSLSTKLCPNTYRPVVLDTFDRIAFEKKQKRFRSRWSHGQIEHRKGLRAEMKEPSSCQYNTVHQWTNLGMNEKPVGNLNVLNRICSARTVGVYH